MIVLNDRVEVSVADDLRVHLEPVKRGDVILKLVSHRGQEMCDVSFFLPESIDLVLFVLLQVIIGLRVVSDPVLGHLNLELLFTLVDLL